MATRASSFVYSVFCEICVCGCVMCLPMWPPAGAGRGSLLCRITNGGEEIFDEEDGDAADPKWLWSVPAVPINTPNPEMGPFPGKRIPHTWFDLQFDKFTFKEDSDFWFTCPPNGWEEHKPVKLQTVTHEPDIVECALNLGPGRVKLEDMREGLVIEGEVNAMSLNHGIQVDIGCEFDGLIAVRDRYMWYDLTDLCKALQPFGKGPLDIEKTIKVRVHKIRDPVKYRWPIQLVLESPTVDCLLPENFDPDSWRCPMDLRDVSTPEQLEEYFTPEELMEATARYRASPQYSFENDELHDDEPYFYPITAIDMNGKEVLRWEEVPRDKDGNQRLAEFEAAAIPLAGYSYLYGEADSDWNHNSAHEEIALNAARAAAYSGRELGVFDGGVGSEFL